MFILHNKLYLIYEHGYQAMRIDIEMISNHFPTVGTDSSKTSFRESNQLKVLTFQVDYVTDPKLSAITHDFPIFPVMVVWDCK